MLQGIQGYELCIGCGVCALPCPLWQQRHDAILTFAGRALALQGGVHPDELRDSVGACLLCGSCEPVCTMGIKTVDITLKLRAALNGGNTDGVPVRKIDLSASDRTMLIPGATVHNYRELLIHMASLLGVTLAEDDGSDVVEAFESGLAPEVDREESFLQILAGVKRVVVTDGIFKRYLRDVLPGLEVIGLGEALLRLPGMRAALKPTDLYIIEARGYNADFDRCMPFYTGISRQTGCVMNLDLQRIAIPTGSCLRMDGNSDSGPKTTEQIRWILEGRRFERIVVEAIEDIDLVKTAGAPVVHVAELTGDDTP